MPALDWLAIRTAATAGLIVVVPAALLAELIVGDGGSSGWAFLFLFLTLLGFVIAGFGAGRLRTDTPLSHGAIAALVCYAVVQLFGAASRLVNGEDLNLLAYPVMAMVAITCGVIGALFADWSQRRARRAPGGRPSSEQAQ